MKGMTGISEVWEIFYIIKNIFMQFLWGGGGVVCMIEGWAVINSLLMQPVREPARAPWWRKARLESKRKTQSICNLSLLGMGYVCMWNHILVCCLKRLLGVKFCHMILASGYDWSQWGSSVCIWGHSMTLPACFHSLYFCVMAPLSRDNLNCSFTSKAICKESFSCVSFHSLSSP